MSKKSQNLNFKSVDGARIPRQWKNKVHDNLFTTRIAEIKPIHYDYLQPGDVFRDRITTYTRTAPLEAPIFSEVKQKHRVYCVPMRKLMPDFEEFRVSHPSDDEKFIYTTLFDLFSVNGIGSIGENGTIEEFLGFPQVCRQWILTINHIAGTQVFDPDNYIYATIVNSMLTSYKKPSDTYHDVTVSMLDMPISLMPFLAYKKIYYDWYNDSRFYPDESEQLFEQIEGVATYPYITYQDSFTVEFEGQTAARNILRWCIDEEFVNYPKDYFTTCSDGSQQGPLLSIGPERLDIYGSVLANQGLQEDWVNIVGSPVLHNGPASADTVNKMYSTAMEQNEVQPHDLAGVGEVWAQVNEADLITPTKLRWQMALQRFTERTNSSGKVRYTDFVFGQLGIRIPDPYLQRSVFIGGTQAPVIVDEVLAQADGSANNYSNNLGEFVGRASLRNSSRGIRGRVAEDCIMMTISFIQPQQYYWQGFNHRLLKINNTSFPHPDFQRVGEAPVNNEELFFGEGVGEPFGYNFRYAADQMALDEIHGDFRGSLAFWHTGRDMPYNPALGFGFLRVQPQDHNRIFAYTASRSMPFYCFTRHYFFHKMPLSSNKAEGRIG